AKLGIAPACPAHRWTKEEEALLGTRPDRAVGGLIARTREAVALRRHKLGIRLATGKWQPAEEALLGTGPDDAIAARLKRTVSAVALRRRRKGIPRWERGRG